MNERIFLDAGPLGQLCREPRRSVEIRHWLERLVRRGRFVVVPEVSDYEVRRNLLLERLERSIVRLDALKTRLESAPATSEIWLHAAQLWADARRRGRPTAHPSELDCDVILAAQALSVDGIVATDNIGHLAQFVEAKHWWEIE